LIECDEIYDGGMIKCVNIIPLTMMYTIRSTFELLGVIIYELTIEEFE